MSIKSLKNLGSLSISCITLGKANEVKHGYQNHIRICTNRKKKHHKRIKPHPFRTLYHINAQENETKAKETLHKRLRSTKAPYCAHECKVKESSHLSIFPSSPWYSFHPSYTFIPYAIFAVRKGRAVVGSLSS
jgi:hypothetical protein